MMKEFPDKSSYIDIHSHHWKSKPEIFRIRSFSVPDFREIPDDIPCSVGLHPWHISLVGEGVNLMEILEEAGKMENVFAFGETGLDKIIDTDLSVQEEIFRLHIEFSEKYNKALVIHCVKAFDVLFELKKEYNPKSPWILHGFSSSVKMAEDIISKGIYISVGERILRKKNKGHDVVTKIPIESLFIETDEDEKSIEQIYSDVATIKMISVNELKENIFNNFHKSFHASNEP